MINLLVVAAIFLFILFIIAVFITQQFYTVQQLRAKEPKSLIEKLAGRGIGALNTDKFKEIVLSGGGEEDKVASLLTSTEESIDQSEKPITEKIGEYPEEKLFNDHLKATGHLFNIENKSLQAVYSEYLSAKNLSPFDLEPDFKLGVAYLKFGQYDKAQNQFQKIADEKPSFKGIFYYLGEALRLNGHLFEAMNAYKQSWEQDRIGPGE